MSRYKKGWYYAVHEIKSDFTTEDWIVGQDIRDYVRANYRSTSFHEIFLVNGNECCFIGSCGNSFVYQCYLQRFPEATSRFVNEK